MRGLRLLLSVALVLARVPTSPADANGLLAFERARPDGSAGSAVWTMRPDGSQLQRVTPDEPDIHADDPTFSLDGSQLAYWQDRARLIVMHPDGSAARPVTSFDPATTHSSGVAWDPLAPRIIFTHYNTDCDDCAYALDAVNLDGSGRRQLHVPGGHADHSGFFPDGRSLVYDTDFTSCSGVYKISRAGTKQRALVAPVKRHGKCLMAASQPSFSPNGRRVAFVRLRQATDTSSIWTLDVRTRKEQRITPWGHIGFDTLPAWSPDSRSLAYDGFVGKAANPPRYIFIIAARKGAKPRRVVSGWSPSWQGSK